MYILSRYNKAGDYYDVVGAYDDPNDVVSVTRGDINKKSPPYNYAFKDTSRGDEVIAWGPKSQIISGLYKFFREPQR